MNQYQTIKYPDGKIVEGAFPTLDWFEKIKAHIDFRDKNIVDIGCAEGIYAVLAKLEGANRVICVDSEKEKANFCKDLFNQYGYQLEIYTAKFEDMAFNMDYDIVFCNMILHWLEDAEQEFRRIADATKQYIVVIYRTANDGYEKGWFPTEEELERLAKSIGFEVKHKELLITQDDNKEIHLVIFERYKICQPVIQVIAKSHKYYNTDWLTKINIIKPYLHNHTIIATRLGGIVKKYIDGRDLWGDKPFHPTYGKNRQVFLNDKEKESIKKIKDSILQAGRETGYYLGDINKRDIILKDGEAYIVDFEVIDDKPRGFYVET